MKEKKIGNARLQVIVGDITSQDTAAVVNAANRHLAPGGGVAGAIHAAAGPGLWQECAKLGGCETGQARITAAYNLPNRHVIHTVGPVYSGIAQDEIDLADCYRNSLALAEENGLASVAFPALSTGIFGYPVDKAAPVALRTIAEFLQGAENVRLVRMVLYDERSCAVHEKALEEIKL